MTTAARPRPTGAPPGVALLALFTALVGSPWVVPWLVRTIDNPVLVPLVWPAWDLPGRAEPSPAAYIGGRWELAWHELTLRAVVFLLLSTVLLRGIDHGLRAGPSRVAAFVAGAGAVLLAAIGAGVLTAILGTDDRGYGEPYALFSQLFNQIAQAASFGLLAGIVVGVLLMRQADDHRVPRPRAGTDSEEAATRARSAVADDTLPGRGGRGPDEATRYLCVAARTDERFVDRMVAELFGTDLRAVAPSIGMNLDPVLRHAFIGSWQRFARDILVLVSAAVALYLAPVFTILILGSGPLAGLMVPRSRASGGGGRTGAVLVGQATGILLAWQLIPEAGAEPDPLVGAPLAAVVPLLLLYGAVVTYQVMTRLAVTGELGDGTREVPSPAVGRWMVAPEGFRALRGVGRRLARVLEAQAGNVTVYGGYRPFVGAGPTTSSWSFALPIRPAAPAGGGPTPDAPRIDVVELIDHVRDRLLHLWTPAADAAAPPADGLPGLRVEDRVFVSGTEAGADERFVVEPDAPPVQRLPPDDVREIARQPRGPVRHYLAAHVCAWGGEVAASSFVHFSTEGRMLYLECAHTVLGPLRAEYHAVDRMRDGFGPAALVGDLARAVGALGSTFLLAPARIAGLVTRWYRYTSGHVGDHLRALDARGYNYGARRSVRELGSAEEYHNYFQVVDVVKYHRVVERHVLAAVLDFLDGAGIDTTELRHRQMTILNHGVVQTGGVSVVTNQAVGTGATVRGGAQPTDGGNPGEAGKS